MLMFMLKFTLGFPSHVDTGKQWHVDVCVGPLLPDTAHRVSRADPLTSWDAPGPRHGSTHWFWGVQVSDRFRVRAGASTGCPARARAREMQARCARRREIASEVFGHEPARGGRPAWTFTRDPKSESGLPGTRMAELD
jgi:hypothetical protein